MTIQKATNVHWHHGDITREDRNRLLNQKAATLWFTGLSGSGKSTIAVALEGALYEMGKISYRLDGDNIRLDLPISLKEAIAGAKVKVPTIDGPVMLSVPAGAQSGTTMRIKGRGFAKKGGERGDQLVTLQIRLPSDLGKLAALAEALPDDPSLRAELGV